MKKIIKALKKFIKALKKIKLWYNTVIREHNNYKLSLYHKLRSIRYGFSSDFYHMYNLEKNNPKDYISEYKRIQSRDINQNYKSIYDNKLLFEKVFGQFVNVPENIIIILDKIYDKNGNIVSKNSFANLLTDKKYIVKPAADTGGGTGVSMLKKIDNFSYSFNNSTYSINELYDEVSNLKGFVINEFVNQHEYSKNINPNSVNTIRLITIIEPNTGDIIIPCAVHRFGSVKSGIVDNMSSGGYVTKIDVENGILLETAYGLNADLTDKHPDTGVIVKGTIIPNWKDITTKVINVAKKFPYLKFIAWDIVVTDDSFCVIEINASSSLELFQVFSPIRNTKLGEFYKYYGYIK